MHKKIAILQSNYIPWKGYFDIIDSVDEFIFYDEVQYTKNDWRNRNRIKSSNGLQWLSIPVSTKDHLNQHLRIMDAKVIDSKWASSHWNTIYQFYKNAPYFSSYKNIFEAAYQEAAKESFLCEINYKFIFIINDILGIKTKISFSQDYELIDGKTERLVDLVQKAGGDEYLSGPAAKGYIDTSLFEKANIRLNWMNYSGYKDYPQLYPPFEHSVTVLDLIFNMGRNAIDYIRDKQYCHSAFKDMADRKTQFGETPHLQHSGTA